MFDLSFSELLLIGIIAIVVVGPRRLPGLLRNAGHIIGRLRRMAADLRTESGIDDILEAEGLRSEIDNFRRLAAGQISLEDLSPNVVPEREREYPRIGCDSYGAVSEDLVPYLPALPEAASVPLLGEGSAIATHPSPEGTVAMMPAPSVAATEVANAPLSPSHGADAKN